MKFLLPLLFVASSANALTNQFEVRISRVSCQQTDCSLYINQNDKETIRYQTAIEFHAGTGKWEPTVSHYGPNGDALYSEAVSAETFMDLVSNAKNFEARALPTYENAQFKIQADVLSSAIVSSEITLAAGK